jgi:hypothetical protein
MRRSALLCHVPPLDSKTSFSAKCHKNFGFTPAFLLICAELPQRRFFFGTSARLIAVARVHSLPGMVGNFLISRRHFAAARTLFRDVPAGLAGRLEHDP